jgi:rhodanese-related sulfurtransferase
LTYWAASGYGWIARPVMFGGIMGLWKQILQWFGAGQAGVAQQSTPPPRIVEEPEPVVPEMTVEELADALDGPNPPLLLDVREPYEWRQVRFAAGLHIPMSEIPQRLAELPQEGAIVVTCAHGSRSYSVAVWLLDQGYRASSLQGGITRWAQTGRPVLQGDPSSQG